MKILELILDQPFCYRYEFSFCRGPASEEKTILSNVMDLDIGETLVPSWNVCCDITQNLTKLKHLKVSNNRWPVPGSVGNDNEITTLTSSLSYLEELVIGEMGYAWEIIFLIARSIPKLR